MTYGRMCLLSCTGFNGSGKLTNSTPCQKPIIRTADSSRFFSGKTYKNVWPARATCSWSTSSKSWIHRYASVGPEISTIWLLNLRVYLTNQMGSWGCVRTTCSVGARKVEMYMQENPMPWIRKSHATKNGSWVRQSAAQVDHPTVNSSAMWPPSTSGVARLGWSTSQLTAPRLTRDPQNYMVNKPLDIGLMLNIA